MGADWIIMENNERRRTKTSCLPVHSATVTEPLECIAVDRRFQMC